MQNINILASLCMSADWFESYLVINPEDRFLASKKTWYCYEWHHNIMCYNPRFITCVVLWYLWHNVVYNNEKLKFVKSDEW